MLAASPADETEVVWLESRRSWSATGGGRELPRDHVERSIVVRVLDRGRLGLHRTSAGSISEVGNAVRFAMAQARTRDRLPGLPHLPADPQEAPELPGLRDPELAALDPRQAEERLRSEAREGERARLAVSESHVAVFNSRGLRRRARATTASLEVACEERPGGGWAGGSARSLATLDPATLFARARVRHGRGRPTDPGPLPTTVVLSAEATCVLCRELRDAAFSAHAYQEGSSFLREHLGVQVFDRELHLTDDATEPRGLPFPFDLEGTAKRPVELIAGGIPRTPALDQRQAAVLGLPPTGHAIGGNDALAGNLFLLPGGLSDRELLERADGGVWIGRLARVECFDPARMLIRARSTGVRRIEGGELGAPLPDLVWEDSLLRAFSSLAGIGDSPVTRAQGREVLGGVTAPAIAIREVGDLRPDGDPDR